MSDVIKQKSEGNSSPNIGGDATNNHFGLKIFSYPKNKSIQIETITKLILLIGEKANSHTREDSEKDLSLKLKQRFSDYEKELENRYSELLDVYSNSYNEAIKHIENIEIISDKIALFLKEKSREHLLRHDDNPLLALRSLVDYFSGELDKNFSVSGDSYDKVAIEFYLFKELINCNVFPNPINK